MTNAATDPPLGTLSIASDRSAGVFTGLLRQHWRPLALTGAISLVTAGLNLAQPLVVNRIISSIGSGPGWALVVLLTFLVVLTVFAEAAQQFMLSRTAESAVFGLRRNLIRRILRLPIPVLDAHRSGDMVSRLGADTTLVRAAFTGGLVQAFGGLLVLIGAIVAMAILDTFMLLIVLFVGVAAVICVLLASSKIQRLTKATQQSVGALGSNLERALSAIRTIRAARAESQIEAEIGQAAHSAYSKGVRIARIESILWPISGLALQVAFLAVLGIGGVRVASGALSVADLVTFVMFLFLVTMPLNQVFSAIVTVRSAIGALQRVHQVLDLPTESSNDQQTGCSHPQDESWPSHPKGDEALAMNNVSFGYNPGALVLKDVSFAAPTGATTAIVGASGSGKSTLLALLERFYDIDNGKILLQGTDISSMDRSNLRSQISYVEQEAPVLAGTVRENLKLGTPQVTDRECHQALKKVNLAARFERAAGLDTILGERGINLSGGERQRLTIARSLLSPAPVLLLDEPTASVDSYNEALVHQAIKAAASERSLIIVAHRLSTVISANQIIVLDSGEIRARGTHRELMRTSQTYKDLARRQLLS